MYDSTSLIKLKVVLINNYLISRRQLDLPGVFTGIEVNKFKNPEKWSEPQKSEFLVVALKDWIKLEAFGGKIKS